MNSRTRIFRIHGQCCALLFALFFIIPSLTFAAPPKSASNTDSFSNAVSLYEHLKRSDPEVGNLMEWEQAAADLLQYVNSAGDSGNRSAFVAKALFTLGQLYQTTYTKQRFGPGLSRAVYYYERMAKDYPGNSLSDDALLALGDIRRTILKDEPAARAAYYEIVDRYKDSDRYDDARKRLGLKPEVALAPPPKSSPSVSTAHEKNKTQVAKNDSKKGKSAVHEEPQITPLGKPEKNIEVEEPKVESSSSAEVSSGQSSDAERLGEVQARDKTGTISTIGLDADNDTKHLPTPALKPDSDLGTFAKRPLIVIDPGHGGEDLGAVGIGGLIEKNVVLSIANMLDELLRDRLHAETVLTRTTDTVVLLQDRTKLANDKKADLFISIHANASEFNNASGVETYYLDNTNDKSSLKLAERENASLPQGTLPGDLGFMVSDLIQNAKLNDSISLAHDAQDNLVNTLGKYYQGVKSLGVKKAPFYVLVGAHMPCVLVEVSFIDHPLDGERLADPRYQRWIATGLYSGIRTYFENRERKLRTPS